MAVFNSSTFGDINKKLGNVVSYRSRGKNILRTQPMKIHDAHSLAQQKVRLRFHASTELGRLFQPVCPVGFPRPYLTESRNAFVSANQEIIEIDDQLVAYVDYRQLACSAGPQEVPRLSAKWGENSESLVVNIQAQNLSAYSSRQDLIYLVLWECESRQIRLISAGHRDRTREVEIDIPQGWSPEFVFLYGFAASANGKRVSATVCPEIMEAR